jgi:translocation and assembly module TamA
MPFHGDSSITGWIMTSSRSAVRIVLAAFLWIASAAAVAGIRVELNGVEGDARRNVLVYLSVERYREDNELDEDTVNRLFNRIDGEARSALRPFGYYDPAIESNLRADGKDWLITINITPGEPVRLRNISIVIDGPGAADPVFDAIRAQRLLRTGARLNHGAYDQVKNELTRTAVANGYMTARLLDNPRLVVDATNHSARIDLQLDTGPRYHFGAVDIEQSVIRPKLMQRYVRFREGEPYDVSQLLRTQFALDDSLYFSSVEVEPGAPDAATLTVPVRITAAANRSQYSLGAGYGTDTSVRGTLGWTNPRVNNRGHRLRFELKGSAITRRVDARYDIPIGDPALERFSLEAINRFEEFSDLDTNETTVRPSITRVRGRWQTVTSLSATHTSTDDGQNHFSSSMLVPGFVIASVPEGFLGEALFSRAFYAELSGSHSSLGSRSNFLRLLLQSEREFDLSRRWHLLLRGEFGTSLVSDFGELPGIYRFFAGGDRSVRGFAYNSLSPEELVTPPSGIAELRKTGGRHLAVGSVELVRDLPRSLAVAAFFDGGNAFNKFGDRLEYAAGLGLRYRLRVVSIGLDVAKPLSTGGSVRFHLNISPKL